MRWITFWEAFCFTALLASPFLGWAGGFGLRVWLNAPMWVEAAGPIAGLASLFLGVWVLVRLDNHRRRKQAGLGNEAESGA